MPSRVRFNQQVPVGLKFAFLSLNNPSGKYYMKTTTPIAIFFLTLASGATAFAENPLRHDHWGISMFAGSYSLEGPAVSAMPNGGEQDVDMYGLRLEGRVAMNEAWYARGVTDLSRLNGGGQLVQANASIGIIRSLATSDTWNIDGYLQAGVEYARSSNLGGYVTNPDFDGTGSGRSGDALGASAEIGISLGFWRNSRMGLFAKYLNFGDGDGVSFGMNFLHDLNETWTLTVGLDALWVDDPGIQIDMDFQRFSVGLLRKF